MAIRDQNFATFGARVREIEKDHTNARRRELRRIARAERVPGAWFPFGKVLMIFVIGLGLKAVFVANLTPEAYAEQIARLESGGYAEQAVALILAPDPLSKNLVAYFQY